MKCPKCHATIPDTEAVCPFCQEPTQAKMTDDQGFSNQDTGRFSAIDPDKDSYDFDLQYTLTFKDAGEIRQAIADMELGLDKERPEEIFPVEKPRETEERQPDYRQRSLEEMEEAAQRAALRRERRKQGKRTSSAFSWRSITERPSRSEREKAALRAAKPRRKRSEQDVKKNRRFMIGTGVAVLVIALIIGTINLFAGMMDGEIRYPTIYAKDNQLFMFYDKKPQLISERLIAAEVSVPADKAVDQKTSDNKSSKNDEDSEDSDSKSSSKTTKVAKSDDPKVYQQAIPTEKQLIRVSNDGMYTYFLENVDKNTGMGDLIYCQNDTPKSRTLVAISVYYKIVPAKDGQGVLFVKNTDDTGYHGELCYWNPDLKEPISVEQDICSDNFIFAQNGQRAMYIKNFNPIVNTGDLCIRDFGKDASNESRMVDEKVAFVFGTTPKSDVYLYAKDYDTKKGTYSLYSLKEGGEPQMWAEKAYLPPEILTKSESVYAYSNYNSEDRFQAISYVDLATGNSKVLSEEISKIVRIRKDENALVYNKSYEDTEKSDYYVVSLVDTTPQKVANAVVDVKDSPQTQIQFDISDDFSRAAYISGYDEKEGAGALITMTIINDHVGTEKRISDNAYGCDVSADGSVVRFASNYDKDANTVSLAAFMNSNTVTLTEGVCAGAYTFDTVGEVMVYARDIVDHTGMVECVSTKGRVRKIDGNVRSYGLKKDGQILLLKKGDNGGQLYYSNEKGNKINLMDDGVTGALFY